MRYPSMAEPQALWYRPHSPMPDTLFLLQTTEAYRHLDENDRYNHGEDRSEMYDATAMKGHSPTQLHNSMALAWVLQPQPRTHTCSLAL